MKKLFVLGMALLLALALCACGSAEAEPDDPNVGLYECTSVVMESVELGAEGEYLDLKNGGECDFFFFKNIYEGTWSLDGENLSITIPDSDMELNAAGTLKDGVIVVTIPELHNSTMTFQKETAEEAPAEEALTEEAPAEEVPAEEALTEEAPAEEAPVEEAPAEEIPAEEGAPQ